MKFLLFTFVFTISLTSFSQEILTKTIDSKELKRKQKIKIYVPKNYKEDTKIQYPAAIILGDQYLFDLYVGNAKLFADADMAPDQIVIGIDMTTTYEKDISIVPATNALTNNASHFYNFIKYELLQYTESNFRISPFISISAEGKAANFITHFLKESEPIFNAFICATPEFSEFSTEIIRSYALQRLSKIDNTFFVFASNSEKHTKKALFNRFNEIGILLSSYELENLQLKFDTFNGSPSFLSTVSESIPRAFDLMFSLYGKITKSEFEQHLRELEPLEAIKYVENKYIDIEYLYGANLKVRLEDIYAIEGIVIDKQNGDYLRVLGDFVSIQYPDLHLGDYYIGKYYEIGEDYEKADFYYKAAYGKMNMSDPNANAFYENIKRVNDLLENQEKQNVTNEIEENTEIEKEEEK